MPLMGFFENVLFPQFSGRLNYKQNTRRLSFEQRVGKGCWEVSLTLDAKIWSLDNILNNIIFILRIRKRHPKNTWQEFYSDTDSEK